MSLRLKLKTSINNIFHSPKEIASVIVGDLAEEISKILDSLPDNPSKQNELKKIVAKHTHCPVEGAQWSLTNALDYNFDGFSADHLTSYSRLLAIKEIGDVPPTPCFLVLRDLCLAAKLAYEEPDLVRYICKEWNMTVESTLNFPKEDTQAFIMYDDNNIVVSFRGTELLDPRDWANDFEVKFKPMQPRESVRPPLSNPPMVHQGFHAALGIHYGPRGIYSEIMKSLHKLTTGSTRKIWVTGHSLGAALASVFVGQMIIEEDILLNNLGGVYTYGQPRCGGEAYCSLFDGLEKRGLVYRVVNKKDVIPHVPVKVLSYKHHGCKVGIVSQKQMTLTYTQKGKKERVKINKPNNKEIHIPGSSLRKVVLILLPGYMEDHFPCEYIRNIEKFMGEIGSKP